MYKNKFVFGLVLLGGLTISGVAWGFSRNLSGLWTTPRGRTVAIVHDPASGKATFTFAFSMPTLGINRLEFPSEVYGMKDLDDGSSANDFMFGGKMAPISYSSKNTTCTLEGDLNGMGTVLGQAPSRKLRMLCKITPTTTCEDGTHKTLEQIDCSGDWQ